MLVFILAVTQSAIRTGRSGAALGDTLTLAELRAAITALRDVEDAMKGATPEAPPASQKDPGAQVTSLKSS